MLVIYWSLMLVLGAYFFQRRFDIFTLAFLSCCIYFLPAAIPIEPVALGAYAIYVSVLAFVAGAAVIFGRIAPGTARDDRRHGRGDRGRRSLALFPPGGAGRRSRAR